MKIDNNQSSIKRLKLVVNNLLSSKKVTHGLGRSLRMLLKEIVLYENHILNADNSKKQGRVFEGEKIQIGGGKHLLKGFLNIDIVPPADIIFDVREGLPLRRNSVGFIFSEHFLEHMDYPISAKKLVRECYRVLQKGGKLVLGVPDSQLVISAYVKKDKKFWQQMLERWYSNRNCLEHFNTYIDLVNYHFRDQDDDQKYNPHYWAYDFEKLASLLKTAGFTELKKWKFDKSIANPKRRWASIYIEAVK